MRRIFVLIMLFYLPFYTVGQIHELRNQFIFNPLVINPGYTGHEKALSAIAVYRNQWVGFDDAPTTKSFTAHSPLRLQHMALGISVISEKIGVVNESSVMGIYAYKLKFSRGILYMGLGVGVNSVNTKWTQLLANDPGDELLSKDSPTFIMPEVSLGLYYTLEKLNIGISIPYLLTHTYNQKRGKYITQNKISEYTYFVNADYTYNLNRDLSVKPAALFSYNKNTDFGLLAISKLDYLNKYSLGLGYDTEQKIYKVLTHLQLNKQLRIGYVMDINNTSINNYSKVSHEFMIRYDFKYTIRVLSPRHF
ncbi:PorP/SprF family type IX secretion system membrane protein [Marinifilum sp. RC60d5]|uniref:PorP/SprF family type IX secretion system membrane protein n=1 Tax=Marinifilum sp. RC60d5 TaxID=3458414 RepID=UPI0040374B25